ncbi:MAG: glycoside hydrolase family 95-like protein, partial [Planctomycetota bacterium]
WDGSIRVFSAWPTKVDCAFKTLRAEGAFLVSAAQKAGTIGPVAIESEAGKRCRLVSPFDAAAKVTDTNGNAVEITIEDDNVICFDTVVGGSYEVQPA